MKTTSEVFTNQIQRLSFCLIWEPWPGVDEELIFEVVKVPSQTTVGFPHCMQAAVAPIEKGCTRLLQRKIISDGCSRCYWVEASKFGRALAVLTCGQQPFEYLWSACYEPNLLEIMKWTTMSPWPIRILGRVDSSVGKDVCHLPWQP